MLASVALPVYGRCADVFYAETLGIKVKNHLKLKQRHHHVANRVMHHPVAKRRGADHTALRARDDGFAVGTRARRFCPPGPGATAAIPLPDRFGSGQSYPASSCLWPPAWPPGAGFQMSKSPRKAGCG